MRFRRSIALSVLLLLIVIRATAAAVPPRFEIVLGSSIRGPITGRLVVILTRTAQPQPRMAVSPQGSSLFAIDIEAAQPRQILIVDERSVGYPVPLSALPDGEYFAQAVINVYERAQRSDGHTIWVKLNDGRQETFGIAAGNIYSDVQPVRVGAGGTLRLTINSVIPTAPPAGETEWVKRVRIQSDKLTRFWGRPIYVHATVLLPKGYAEHPAARYPVIFANGHSTPFSFSPDSARARNIGQINPVTGLDTGYDFYKNWNGEGFPRFIAVSFEQQTPYFPDSYSINSANNGPYGDAIVEEVIPALEKQFRMIGKPYARIVEGASTGGWQSLALQLHYPDFFGGAWVLQPDPIDFRRYQLVNIYEDENAFSQAVGVLSIERPFRRTVEGQAVWSMRQMSLFEEVLGSRGRSSYQLEGWEAVYGPVGTDGYPKPLWNKITGKIDREVANYMREHGYDLREYAQRNWATLGSKLAGKLHFFAGDMDDFYLNLAVYRFEDFLKSTTNPKSDATFVYGRPMKGHSWHAWTWAQMVRDVGAYVKARAGGDDTRVWNY